MYLPALALAGEGNASNVDLLVGDIYGGDYDEYGLPADVVAASLGKLARPKDRKNANPCDLARGILDAITNNVVRLSVCVCVCVSVCVTLLSPLCAYPQLSSQHPLCFAYTWLRLTKYHRVNWRCCTREPTTCAMSCSPGTFFGATAFQVGGCINHLLYRETERQRDKETDRTRCKNHSFTHTCTHTHTHTHTHTLSLSLSFTSSVQ